MPLPMPRAMTYHLALTADGHFLVASGETRKPVALFYAHNVQERVAKRRAEKFIEAMK